MLYVEYSELIHPVQIKLYVLLVILIALIHEHGYLPPLI